MPALDFTDAGFGLFLSNPLPAHNLDLSNASVSRILTEYQTYQRKRNKNYSLSPCIYNIRLLEQHYKVEILPSHVNDEFWMHFQIFLLRNGVAPSTVCHYFNTIRAALKWSSRHHVVLTETFDIFNVPKYRKTMVCLAPFEVASIYYFDIDALPCRPQHRATLKRARDLFVLSCMLGQRHSDMIRIEPNCFSDNGNIFTIVQQKTGNRAVVDINKLSMDSTITKDILARYDYHSPYTADLCNYNKHIHDLFKCIGGEFNADVISQNKILGKINTLSLKKYRSTTSHTGRRTFVNYAMQQEIPIREIMKGTGHVDLRSFQKYWCEEVRSSIHKTSN